MFKVGDRIRRTTDPVRAAPIGFETVVVEPEFDAGAVWVWYVACDGDTVYGDVNAFELISENPVRTVTRLEPVEGKYGIVQLDVHNGQIVVTISPEDGHQPSGDELRSAAMILSQIAEYRDEVTK